MSCGSWFCQRPDPSRPELGWAGLARVSPSIAPGTAINIVKPAREELQHQQNGKVLCDTLLPLFCTSRLGTSQVDGGAWWRETDSKGKTERGGVVCFETPSPNNQYLTSSQQFCWLKGNIKGIWSAWSNTAIQFSSVCYSHCLHTFISCPDWTFFLVSFYLEMLTSTK